MADQKGLAQVTQEELERQGERQQLLVELGCIINAVRVRLDIKMSRLAQIADVRRRYLYELEKGEAQIQRGSIFRISRSLVFTVKERKQVYELVKVLCTSRRVHRRHLFVTRRKALPRKMMGGHRFGRQL